MHSATDFISKVFFYNRVSAGMLKGEDEHVVIGGIYEVERLA
jgi:NAD+--dinitrogen-reductase ADP-D-ribosyltransferase